jgi:hypothetical protein
MRCGFTLTRKVGGQDDFLHQAIAASICQLFKAQIVGTQAI